MANRHPDFGALATEEDEPSAAYWAFRCGMAEAECDRSQDAIRRAWEALIHAMSDLDVPGYYGPGSAWNQMAETSMVLEEHLGLSPEQASVAAEAVRDHPPHGHRRA